MKIAFYAPMKPPTAARPSGDRTIGRLLTQALEAAGCNVALASALRTWSGEPDPERLSLFRDAAAAQRERLLVMWGGANAPTRPDIWFTYHNHYKAPDLLGPGVAAALRIPYVIAEASYSARRARGPWAEWLGETQAGIGAAQAIFSFTARDEAGLRSIARADRLKRLTPFIADIPPALPSPRDQAGGPVRLVSVAMMRAGAKAESYRLLAATLGALTERHWTLDVIGDGALQDELVPLLVEAGGEKVRTHGRLEGAALGEVLGAGDVFVWPGIDEAFGMAYLEAQAHGLPVAACDTAGVGEVVRHGECGLLAAETTPGALAAVVDRLIASPALRQRLGARAREHIVAHHSIGSAAEVLGTELKALVARG